MSYPKFNLPLKYNPCSYGVYTEHYIQDALGKSVADVVSEEYAKMFVSCPELKSENERLKAEVERLISQVEMVSKVAGQEKSEFYRLKSIVRQQMVVLKAACLLYDGSCTDGDCERGSCLVQDAIKLVEGV